MRAQILQRVHAHQVYVKYVQSYLDREWWCSETYNDLIMHCIGLNRIERRFTLIYYPKLIAEKSRFKYFIIQFLTELYRFQHQAILRYAISIIKFSYNVQRNSFRKNIWKQLLSAKARHLSLTIEVVKCMLKYHRSNVKKRI